MTETRRADFARREIEVERGLRAALEAGRGLDEIRAELSTEGFARYLAEREIDAQIAVRLIVLSRRRGLSREDVIWLMQEGGSDV